ncbi:MAG: hypothetical protein Q7T87_17000 [Polaromonas sp.]|nr:hypothetical protein [Polaromonas sp.]
MFPSKRLYYCQACKSKIFTDRDLVVQMAWENTTMKMLDGKPVSGRGYRNSGRDTLPAQY